MIYDDYLSALAKILAEQTIEDNDVNNLYQLVNEELYNKLEELYFPSMPQLSRRLENLLLSIKGYSVCPEIIGKEVLAVFNHYTNTLIPLITHELEGDNFNWLTSNATQIPIILVDSKEIKIEAVNNFWGKTSITKEEYKLLIRYSNKSKIALNRMIKFFMIAVPLKNHDRCFILDNTYHTATSLLGSVVCKSIYKVWENDVKYLKPNSVYGVEYVLCKKEEYTLLLENNVITESNVKQIENLEECAEIFTGKCARLSLVDELNYAVSSLLGYYNNNMKECEFKLFRIRDDRVRNDDSYLVNFGEELEAELNEYKTAREQIENIIYRMEKVISAIDAKWNQHIDRKLSFVTERLSNMIFEYYFSVAGIDAAAERKCIKHLLDLNYENSELLLTYSKSINGTKVARPNATEDVVSWECAKMYIHFIDEICLNDEIERLLRCIGKRRLTTGKEWFYWGLLTENEEAIVRAVQLGCELAENRYFAENRDDYKAIDMLSQLLHPEACFKKGSKAVQDTRKYITEITDNRLVYLKIAAVVGNNNAMLSIVNMLFRNTVWQLFASRGVPLKKEDIKENFMLTCNTILGICNYLLSKETYVRDIKEMMAVTNFCLNRNLSEVRSTFYNRATSAAYMCKGYMFEYGQYETKNLDKALDRYSKVDSKEIPAVVKAKARVRKKIDYYNQKEQDEYKKDSDYSASSSSEVVGSSGCFITTAASCALHKGRDCDELNFLRKFRDEYIKASPEGRALVEEYYNVAPKIIQKINCEANASDIYAALWEKYIISSTNKILEEQWQEAQDIYVAMVVDLSRKYNIVINTEGYEKLYASTMKRLGYCHE